MSKQVPWREDIYQEFCKLAMLGNVEREILRLRIMQVTVAETAELLRMSESSVNRAIRMLKIKYDKVQPLSDILPMRKSSAIETWMDNN